MNHYIVGIDLGTTNTVAAYAEAGSEDIRLFEIEQLIAPGEVKAGNLLPSLRYHPAPGELASGDLRLPWIAAGTDEQAVIGRLARKLGAQVPGRLVASAKSWLSHAAVDRMAPILPWGASADVVKVSPTDASASYLAHVRAAWNWRFPHAPLEQQDIVLTVPASFDESARALTVKAAAQAGLPRLRLLEEPQAAFYDWLFRHRQTLAAELAQTRLILVCDVGGGTTDFSLITVELKDGQPQLTRIGVGKHLMLGGDNMDLVLAHMAEARLAAESEGASRLSASALSQLIERCRAAKEQLLAADAPEKTSVTLLGSGARLISGARSVELLRTEVERALVDGFFPMVASEEQVRPRRGGIVEFGLPYASDPAVTRHLASFLQQHAADAQAIPDTLLLNGGVFRADALTRRLQETLALWRSQPLRLLHNDNPDVAVARGAVAYALARQGRAPKIGGGSPHSYFLLLDDVRSEKEEAALHGICLLPRGSEEGREILLRERVFALRVGQPVRFHLVSSSFDASGQAPQAGTIVDLAQGEVVRLPTIATVLQADAAGGKQDVPVQLACALTEVGTLEMHCVSTTDPSRRWLLEFQLRDHAEQAAQDEAEYALPPRFDAAAAQIDRIFGARAQQVPAKDVRQLRQQLEKLLGSRERWHTPLLRKLFDLLWERARGRRRSADHERLWLNVAGYCLRPGFGYPLDDWRIAQLWLLYETGVQYRSDNRVTAEWWTLWRRVAGGLSREAQLRLLEDFAFNVQGGEAEATPPPASLVKGSEDDMLRLAASLERIPADYKTEIGTWLFERLQQAEAAPQNEPILWAIGRIGARQPLYGSAHDVVPAEVAAQWLQSILALNWKRSDTAAFAAAYLARMTGDRARDLPLALREQVMQRLAAVNAPAAWSAMVREQVQLDAASERLVLGEALPPGLKLTD